MNINKVIENIRYAPGTIANKVAYKMENRKDKVSKLEAKLEAAKEAEIRGRMLTARKNYEKELDEKFKAVKEELLAEGFGA